MVNYRKRFVFLVLLLCLILSGCHVEKPVSSGAALFSWDAGVIRQQQPLFRIMEERGLDALYQNFSKDLEQEDVSAFVGAASKRGIGVYFLTGDPQWALQEDGESLCAEIDRAAGINRVLSRGKLKGVLIDVEPYLLDEWEDGSSKKVMESFVSCMKAAYNRAQKYGLEVIACIPYFFDSKGFEEELETLIGSCCDKVAVMNYYRGKEIGHIETEAALAKKYEKNLISIYELKEPGSHGLTENNTYYAEGLGAVKENFANLKEAYEEQTVSMALHDFEALEEVLRRE